MRKHQLTEYVNTNKNVMRIMNGSKNDLQTV